MNCVTGHKDRPTDFYLLFLRQMTVYFLGPSPLVFQLFFLNGISCQQRIIDSYLLHLWQMHLRKSHGCFCFLFWFVLSQVSYTVGRERPTWVLSAVFVTGYCQCGCCIGSHAERSEVDLHLPGIGNQCSLGCSSGQTQGTFSLDVNELASVSVFVCLAFNCFARNDRRHCLMT